MPENPATEFSNPSDQGGDWIDSALFGTDGMQNVKEEFTEQKEIINFENPDFGMLHSIIIFLNLFLQKDL